MAIAIYLGKRPYQGPVELTRDKSNLVSAILKYYGSYFEPKRIEIWQYATNEVLGGKSKAIHKVESREEAYGILDGISKRYATNPEGILDYLEVMVRGVWRMNHSSAPGYIQLNNSETWRGDFGDLEINALASGEVSDIIDLLWRDSNARTGLMSNFIDTFQGYDNESFDVDSMLFALGVPHEVSVGDWFASYFKRLDLYLVRLLGSIEKDNPSISSYIRLVNRLALSSDLYDISFFRAYLRQASEKTNVEIDFKHSLKLVGRSEKSYRNLYNELTMSIPHILKHALERDAEIKLKLANEAKKLTGQQDLESGPDS